MFKRVLVANRGLIQANCVRAIKELGATAIAVYEGDDRDSAGVRNADEAHELKVTDPSIRPYLDLQQIVNLAENIDADAVHPGYGFLAQNGKFARELEKRNIRMIAPRTEGRFNLSNKHEVKEAALRSGLPVIPGSGIFSDREMLEPAARSVGFPLVMKAAHGYGGVGMRVLHNHKQLEAAFDGIQSTCSKFLMNSPEVFLESYLANTRLVEFPVLRDANGLTVVFPELECPLQRRFQKLILESPSPFLDATLRHKLRSEIEVLCQRLNIFGFASVEFLVRDNQAYFLEINGYIQPSHTATTLLTGIDLLKEQIRLISGESLDIGASELNPDRHVITTYLSAEDPEMEFAPSPGQVDRIYLPFGEEVVLQTSIFSGAKISPFYDPMVAKLLVRGRNRREAILKMGIALEEFFVEGVKTNIPLMRGVLQSGAFRDGTLTPGHMENPDKRNAFIESLKSPKDSEIAAMVASLVIHRDGDTLKRMEVQEPDESSQSVLGAATRWLKPRKSRRSR